MLGAAPSIKNKLLHRASPQRSGKSLSISGSNGRKAEREDHFVLGLMAPYLYYLPGWHCINTPPRRRAHTTASPCSAFAAYRYRYTPQYEGTQYEKGVQIQILFLTKTIYLSINQACRITLILWSII